MSRLEYLELQEKWGVLTNEESDELFEIREEEWELEHGSTEQNYLREVQW